MKKKLHGIFAGSGPSTLAFVLLSAIFTVLAANFQLWKTYEPVMSGRHNSRMMLVIKSCGSHVDDSDISSF